MTDVWSERPQHDNKHDNDAREPFDIDYARIVHSGSFRRLQGKTQILNIGDGDFYRTRLTHSLEVAQIAGGVTQQLDVTYRDHPAHASLPPRSLIQTAGFGHDLGHPPFGHGGEVALNYCMRNSGGFEGNGQTLRLLTRLEDFSDAHGSNLTRRALLAILKYPVSYSAVANPDTVPHLADGNPAIRILDQESCRPPKCYFASEKPAVEWMIHPMSPRDRDTFQSFDIAPGAHGRPKHKSFDCSIMDMSDDIAYGVHDLEDAIALKLITENHFRTIVRDDDCGAFLDIVRNKKPVAQGYDPYDNFVSQLFGVGKDRKRLIGRLVNHFITHVEINTVEELQEPLVRYRAAMAAPQAHFLDRLKDLVWEKVIRSPEVKHVELEGQRMIISVFEAIQSDPRSLLPNDRYADYSKSDGDPRIICDYVAGMTDGFLIKTYERL